MNHYSKYVATAVVFAALGGSMTYLNQRSTISALTAQIAQLESDSALMAAQNSDAQDVSAASALNSTEPGISSNQAEQIATLRQQNQKLTAQLAKQRQQLVQDLAVDPLEQVMDQDGDKPAKPSGLAALMKPEILKSMIPMKVQPLATELTTRLELDQEQAAKLSQLLTTKANAEIDSMGPLLTELSQGKNFALLGSPSSDDDSEQDSSQKQRFADLTANLAASTEAQRQQYEDSVRELLSSSQFESYRRYEAEKQNQQQQMMASVQQSQFMASVDNLTEFQREEIQRIFSQSSQLNSKKVKIGSFGSMNDGMGGSHRINVDDQLQQVLSSEQWDAYQAEQRRMAASLGKMFSGR